MRWNFIALLLIITLSFSLTSAYQTHEQNTTLYYSFTSNNAIECNLTTGNTPYGLVVLDQPATKNGQTFNNTILYSNFTTSGDYCFNLVCSDGSTIASGNFCRTVTFNGNTAPEGSVIVLFSIAFLIIIFFMLYELIMVIGHFASLDLDAVDLAKSMGTYFTLFALYALSKVYLGNPFMDSWMLILLGIGGLTHVIVPIIGFLISITIGSLKKKKLEFGTQRIYRRNKIGKV